MFYNIMGCVFLTLTVARCDLKHAPTVETTTGPIQGSIHTYDGTTVHVFKGIPYAAPPVGDLRFAPPQPTQSWTEPLVATSYGNRCVAGPMHDALFYQPNRQPPPMNEDCLYLNVAVPITKASKKAVMVFIHGGALIMGSASDTEPEALAIAGDVIHVTINYRLNIYGFLATELDDAPGNVGMLDQVAAFRWVKENIESFGGDADRVTIFGVSGGGWSVNTHMVSPLSKGLFSRGISQSGSLYGLKQFTRSQAAERAAAFAQELGCPDGEGHEAMLACLRAQTSDKLFEVSQTDMFFGPNCVTYGDDFLPMTVKEMYDNHRAHEGVEYMLGTTSEEGGLALMMAAPQPEQLLDLLRKGVKSDDIVFSVLLYQTAMMAGATGGSLPQTIDMIKSFYLPDYSNSILNMRGLLDAWADNLFVVPTIAAARRAAEQNPGSVYLYSFDQAPTVKQGESIPGNFPLMHQFAAPELEFGTMHGLDGFYTLGMTQVSDAPLGLKDVLSEEDRILGKSVVNSWANFAKTGSIQIDLADGSSIKAPSYDTDEHYILWSHPMTSDSIKSRLRSPQIYFWNTLIPSFLETNQPDTTIHKDDSPIQDKDEL